MFGLLNGILSVSTTYILKYKLAPATYESLAMVGGAVGGDFITNWKYSSNRV